jgi:ABC-type molybdenum transport system ATPase subunit/photorepair protein PhrA
MDFTAEGYELKNLTRFSVIIGKNGCGKSTLLKSLTRSARSETGNWGTVKYLTPERGGTLTFDQNIEANARSSAGWLDGQLEQNQFSQFKQQTIYQFDNMILGSLQKFKEDSDAGRDVSSMDQVVQINTLLDNIEIRGNRGERGFKIHLKNQETELQPQDISSGESELIGLGIETLAFTLKLDMAKPNLLLMDEPDVHLHPDLQARLVRFLSKLLSDNPSLHIVIATHSTPILSEASALEESSVGAMIKGQTVLKFEKIDEIYKQILPVFGAHPLTSVFSESPILLVEGTDEVRIWQQAARSSQGDIHFYPVDVGGIGNMPAYEDRVIKISEAIYENATSFSLRDRDGGVEEIENTGPLVRCKLKCHASENLLLSDTVLVSLGIDWSTMKERIEEWIAVNPAHSKLKDMKAFQSSGFDRLGFKLKEVRIALLDIAETNKPWEVLVGQELSKLTRSDLESQPPDNAISDYLGQAMRDSLLSVMS